MSPLNKIVCNRCGGSLRFDQHIDKMETWSVNSDTGVLMAIINEQFEDHLDQSIYCPKCDGEETTCPDSPLNFKFECYGGEVIRVITEE